MPNALQGLDVIKVLLPDMEEGDDTVLEIVRIGYTSDWWSIPSALRSRHQVAENLALAYASNLRTAEAALPAAQQQSDLQNEGTQQGDTSI